MWKCQKVNNKGFTLIEVILILTLFIMLVSVFPLIVSTIPHIFPPTEQPHNLQMELFFNQLSMEIREAEEIQVNGSTLILLNSMDKFTTIEKAGTLLRRRVNGEGHDVFLRHVSSVTYQLVPSGVLVTVIDTNGRLYERRFSMVCCRR